MAPRSSQTNTGYTLVYPDQWVDQHSHVLKQFAGLEFCKARVHTKLIINIHKNIFFARFLDFPGHDSMQISYHRHNFYNIVLVIPIG